MQNNTIEVTVSLCSPLIKGSHCSKFQFHTIYGNLTLERANPWPLFDTFPFGGFTYAKGALTINISSIH